MVSPQTLSDRLFSLLSQQRSHQIPQKHRGTSQTGIDCRQVPQGQILSFKQDYK